jgi:hypothetical protein
MHDADLNADGRDARLQALAAELTSAAYSVALRHGAWREWVDLELELWKALTETVRRWDRAGGRGRRPEDEPPRVCVGHRGGEAFPHLVGGE